MVLRVCHIYLLTMLGLIILIDLNVKLLQLNSPMVLKFWIRVLVAWSPSGATLQSHHECALSQVSSHPDMTLDVVRT